VAKSLGIFVSSDQHLDKIIKLCKAAKVKGIDVTIFFSHLGTLLTQEKRFDELKGLARMILCKVAFERQGLRPPVPGIGEKDFATQARHAEVIDKCDRYVVF
jgi:predicted peroxiredoxin